MSVGVAAGAGELMADRAYAEMRDRIVTLRIPPGSPIDEDALGKELDMGRTPVREAIKRLSLENLVTVFPRRGTFASEINITDLAHIADVRVQLEAHAAYRAAERVGPAQREELEELLAELERSDASGPTRARWCELDTRVHRFIYPLRGQPVPRGDARALPEPLAAHLAPGHRPPAAPLGAGPRALATCWPRSATATPSARGRSPATTSSPSSARSARSSDAAPTARGPRSAAR